MSDSVLRKKLLSEGIVILNGRYRLFVSSDALEAYLIKEGPGPELLWQDVPSVVQDLKNLGITYGLLQEPEEERGGKLVVARGKGPQRGQDARVEFIIDLSRGPLKEEGPDRVIYRELNTIVCVKAGQPVARKIPPGSGSPGMNVFGEPLAPFPGKDVHFVYGPGLEADELLLKAKHDGVFLLEGEKPVVSPVYVLDSDLDWSVGNIHFFGEKLIINGNIKRGFSLHVEGDLEIKGSVEDNVKIFVSGDLYVGGIIQGEILIECKGNATINALEYGHIQVSGNLVVLDYLLQPFCLVGKNFRLLEGLGVILGGKCLVGGSAEVYILGNEAHVRADFRVGYDPHIFDKLADIRQRKLTLQQQRRDLSKVLEKGTKLLKEGKLSLDKINLVNKIKQFLGDINNELRRTSLEEKLLAKTFKKLRNNTLRIERRIFPGVHIGIADADLSIITRLGGGTFFLREEGISFRPASG